MYQYNTVRYTIKDIYVQGNMKNRVDYTTYSKIWTTFAGLVKERLIDKGESLKIPKGLGSLTVYKKKTGRKQMIDYNKTKQLGMIIYHNNLHSDSYYAYFDWDTNHKGRKIFKFRPTRDNSRYLAKCIKNKNNINIYFEKE